MPLYWLTYQRNARLSGVAIISGDSLMAARKRAAMGALGAGAMFEQEHALDSETAARVRRRPHCWSGSSGRRAMCGDVPTSGRAARCWNELAGFEKAPDLLSSGKPGARLFCEGTEEAPW
jgi:hypothetical protein